MTISCNLLYQDISDLFNESVETGPAQISDLIPTDQDHGKAGFPTIVIATYQLQLE